MWLICLEQAKQGLFPSVAQKPDIYYRLTRPETAWHVDQRYRQFSDPHSLSQETPCVYSIGDNSRWGILSTVSLRICGTFFWGRRQIVPSIVIEPPFWLDQAIPLSSGHFVVAIVPRVAWLLVPVKKIRCWFRLLKPDCWLQLFGAIDAAKRR